jgi:MoaA/NifB/PqqE/SkfB family radical SAM enzyme
MQASVAVDLLGPGPIREFRLDLTTRCNLRCVYCAVSQPWYSGEDMAREVLKKVVPAIAGIAAYNSMTTMSVNGHGETTIVEGWTEVVTPLVDAGLPVAITTNLAKEYSDDELHVLGRMGTIAVSIDSCDRELLRRMRRRVDVRQIVTNINRIRAAALDSPPNFDFLSGLYDKNSLQLEAFARFAIALGIRSMNFWQMSKYDYDSAAIPEQDRPLPLDELPEERLRPCLEAVARGFEILRKYAVPIYVHGDHISRLAERVGMHV